MLVRLVGVFCMLLDYPQYDIAYFLTAYWLSLVATRLLSKGFLAPYGLWGFITQCTWHNGEAFPRNAVWIWFAKLTRAVHRFRCVIPLHRDRRRIGTHVIAPCTSISHAARLSQI